MLILMDLKFSILYLSYNMLIFYPFEV